VDRRRADRGRDAFILARGKYTLRVEGTWQNFQEPLPVTVKVEQNINRGVNFCLAFGRAGAAADFGLIRKFTVESNAGAKVCLAEIVRSRSSCPSFDVKDEFQFISTSQDERQI
jgi:hypothetical protein